MCNIPKSSPRSLDFSQQLHSTPFPLPKGSAIQGPITTTLSQEKHPGFKPVVFHFGTHLPSLMIDQGTLKP